MDKRYYEGGNHAMQAVLALANIQQAAEQEAALKQFAFKHSLWIDECEVENWHYIAHGTEAMVYEGALLEEVRKIVDYRVFGESPLEYLYNRIALHNFLFPETGYHLVGFTRFEGAFSFVVGQPFIVGTPPTLEEIAEEMQQRGFDNMGGYCHVGCDYIVEDLHRGNVLKDSAGRFYFIDTVPSLNTAEDGFGGNRTYQPAANMKPEQIETLNAYHRQKSEEAQQSVQKMTPLIWRDKIVQTERNLEII
jgi:hypothetical protein